MIKAEGSVLSHLHSAMEGPWKWDEPAACDMPESRKRERQLAIAEDKQGVRVKEMRAAAMGEKREAKKRRLREEVNMYTTAFRVDDVFEFHPPVSTYRKLFPRLTLMCQNSVLCLFCLAV